MSSSNAGSRNDVVLASEDGQPTGIADKMLAHTGDGMRHLAVSVQLVDVAGNWILQRRAQGKQLFAGRWANSFCTHPLEDEPLAECVLRRATEELGIEQLRSLRLAGSFVYWARDPETRLVEFEYDRVYVAIVEGELVPDPEEICDLRYMTADDVALLAHSDTAAPWLTPVADLAASALGRYTTSGP